MAPFSAAVAPKRIAFVSTRISGTDGVSLEITKWAEVLERMGHSCYYLAGQCDDRPPERSRVIPEAHFTHPVIAEINRRSFGVQLRHPQVSELIRDSVRTIKGGLHQALERFRIDILIAENCLTIPMNIPLGLALVETVMETGIGCIAHHHDFVWERERFMVNAVDDYIQAAFPPHLSEIQHLAINSVAAQEFSRRTGLPCRVIPNVMDFESPPEPNGNGGDFRRDIGLDQDDVLILQPTRVVQRKGIETSIELVRRLDDPRQDCHLFRPEALHPLRQCGQHPSPFLGIVGKIPPGQLQLHPGHLPTVEAGDPAAGEGGVEGDCAAEAALKAGLQAHQPLLGTGAVGVAETHLWSLHPRVGAHRWTVGRHGVAVDAQHGAGSRQGGQAPVVGAVAALQQGLDQGRCQGLAVDRDVPAGVGLHHAVFADVVLGPVQVDEGAADLGGDEMGRNGFENTVDLPGSHVSVLGNLLCRQSVEVGHLGGHPQACVGHGDQQRQFVHTRLRNRQCRDQKKR